MIEQPLHPRTRPSKAFVAIINEVGDVTLDDVRRAQLTVAAMAPRDAVPELLDMLGINHPVVTP